MIRLLMWLLLIYIGYRVIKSITAGKGKETADSGPVDTAAVTHRDPVCGMYVAEDDAVIGRLDNQRHYFCSMECLEKFREQLEDSSRT